MEAHDKIFAILNRVVKIPMHQYARYFERFRQLAHARPLEELVPADTLTRFRAEVEAENATFQAGPKGELEIERDLRTRSSTSTLSASHEPKLRPPRDGLTSQRLSAHISTSLSLTVHSWPIGGSI